MHLDLTQTRIAVRERSLRELFDLALHVLAQNFGPVMGALAVGALPFALVNAWLLSALLPRDGFESHEGIYVLVMAILVLVQQPLASAAATLYLGQAMFLANPSWRRVWQDLRATLGQLLLAHGLFRGVLPAWLFAWLAAGEATDSGIAAGLGWLMLLALYVCVIRAIRPFLSEVILLERNPFRAPRSGVVTTGIRSANLHAGSTGELFAHWLTSAGLALVLGGSLWLALWWLRLHLFDVAEFDRPMFEVFLPLAMWLVGGYFAVLRYLSYLDLRIRREGWELELRMRSEAARLA